MARKEQNGGTTILPYRTKFKIGMQDFMVTAAGSEPGKWRAKLVHMGHFKKRPEVVREFDEAFIREHIQLSAADRAARALTGRKTRTSTDYSRDDRTRRLFRQHRGRDATSPEDPFLGALIFSTFIYFRRSASLFSTSSSSRPK